VILVVEIENANISAHLDGSIAQPRKWMRLTVENVDLFIFGGFINEFLVNIENFPVPGDYANHKIILWDNLCAHKIPFVTNIIEDKESQNIFASVDWPPYHAPKLVPIEHILCELAAKLCRRYNRDWTVDDLRQNVIDIIRTIRNGGILHATFVHCGYPN